MNLQQTIADLETQANRYSEAANALRALLQDEESASEQSSQQAAASKQGGKKARGTGARRGVATKAGKKRNAKGSTKGNTGHKKRAISADTRAKMAAAAKARHQRQNDE